MIIDNVKIITFRVFIEIHRVFIEISRVFIETLRVYIDSFLILRNNTSFSLMNVVVNTSSKIIMTSILIIASIETTLILRQFTSSSQQNTIMILQKQKSIIVIEISKITKNSTTNKMNRSKKLKSIITKINFKLHDDVIFYVKNDVFKFCIFENCQQKIFKIVYDNNFHVEQHRVYRKLIESIYISKMSRKLRMYFRHCSICQLNQIKRHSSYNELTFIFTFVLFFHIIVMNFILTLSKIKNMNVTFNLIDKTSREVQIIFDQFI